MSFASIRCETKRNSRCPCPPSKRSLPPTVTYSACSTVSTMFQAVLFSRPGGNGEGGGGGGRKQLEVVCIDGRGRGRRRRLGGREEERGGKAIPLLLPHLTFLSRGGRRSLVRLAAGIKGLLLPVPQGGVCSWLLPLLLFMKEELFFSSLPLSVRKGGGEKLTWIQSCFLCNPGGKSPKQKDKEIRFGFPFPSTLEKNKCQLQLLITLLQNRTIW